MPPQPPRKSPFLTIATISSKTSRFGRATKKPPWTGGFAPQGLWAMFQSKVYWPWTPVIGGRLASTFFRFRSFAATAAALSVAAPSTGASSKSSSKFWSTSESMSRWTTRWYSVRDHA